MVVKYRLGLGEVCPREELDITREGETMGIFLNPGKAAFEEAVNSEIYVDKTEMIGFLNSVVKTKQKYVSVSRPRRFGKTMAADMICAYYDREADSRELFEKRKLAECEPVERKIGKINWDKYLGAFDVIRLVMTRFFKQNKSVSKALEDMQSLVIRDYKKEYPDVELFDEKDLIQTLDDVYSNVDRQVVIVIDEWDAVFRERREDREGQTDYLDFLRDLMKDNSHIALVYMTGILPIKKYGRHSALNMFDEYSMISPKSLARYVGFTDDEVRDICKKRNMDYTSMKDWYDGYHISNDPSVELIPEARQTGEKSVYEIYSPQSVVNAVFFRKIENYWNKTETYEALAEYIRMDYDGLKDAVALLMDGGRVQIDTSTYQNDMTTFHGRDDILSLLIHLGYLGYDDTTREVFIPNREILDEFKTSTKSDEWADTFEAFRLSQKLLKATWEGDADEVARFLEKAHDRAGNKTYNDETALSYAVQYAYYAAQKYYTIIPEMDTGKGYADIVYIPSPKYPDKPVLLLELKYDKTAQGAISQIKKQNYPDRLEHYKGNILLVGIDYDRDVSNTSPEFKRHRCVIERA